jgi:hypothetical protein
MTKFLTLKEMRDDGKELAEQVAKEMEPEPVAWLNKLGNGAWIADVLKCEGDEPSEPLYATPPQREWQGLTDEDFSAINQSCSTKLQAATSAESILKEKNI